MPEPARVWGFHAGALGDFVLTWPLLRALVRGGAEVTVVADGAKARLAASWLSVRPVDAEQRRFTRLWTGEAADDPVRGVQRVVTFTIGDRFGESTAAGIGDKLRGALLDLLEVRHVCVERGLRPAEPFRDVGRGERIGAFGFEDLDRAVDEDPEPER